MFGVMRVENYAVEGLWPSRCRLVRTDLLKDQMTLKSRGPIPIYYESLYGI